MIKARAFLKLCSNGERWTINFKICNISEVGDRLVLEVLSDKTTFDLKEERE